LGLQFFIAGLREDISMEVVKSGTTDMYQAFLTAHAYETALRDKQGKNSPPEPIKINETDANFKEDYMHAEIEAIKCKYQQKIMFTANNGSAYQQCSNRGNGSSNNATAMAAINNPDLDQAQHANQIQLSVRLAINVRRKIISNWIATRENEMMPLWSRFRRWKSRKGARALKVSSNQNTKSQFL